MTSFSLVVLLATALASEPTDHGAVRDLDPVTVPPVGRWPNGTAFSIVADADGRFVYAGSGGTVLVVESGEQPGARTPVAEIVTEGFVFGLAVAGGDLFVAGSRGGFFHADVSDPRRPGPATRIGGTGEIAYDVAVRGELVAFAEGAAGVAFYRRDESGVVAVSRLAIDSGRALGVALGDGFALLAAGDGDLLRVDLADVTAPKVTARTKPLGFARSVALTVDGRFALVAEDLGDLVVRDPRSLEVVTRKRFVLPALTDPGPQRSPKPETPLAVSRVRVLRARAYVGLEGTEMSAQISPFTPEFGAWRGEPHYDPRAATAIVDLAPDRGGKPSLNVIGFADELRGRSMMNWIKDVAPLPNGDVLALDFVTGAFRFRPAPDRKRRDGLPGMIDLGFEIDTRAGAMDCVFSPTREDLLYAASDIAGLQILDVSDPTKPSCLHRLDGSGGTFCAITTRLEKDADGVERPIDYVFINNFFRVTICRIDPRDVKSARVLAPLWITLPEAIRGKREYEALGLSPRSYRVTVDGDFLDVVSTNTVFGWQRFSIDQVLAWTHEANIYEGIDRPAEFARDCPPLFRAVTSPDHLADSTRLRSAPFARAGRTMSILASGDRVILGSGGHRNPAGGRGGRGAPMAPFDGGLQYFDLSDPIVDDPMLGPLRFPRGTRFFPGGEIQIGLAARGDELFVADTLGILRVVDFVAAPSDPGAHGEGHFAPRDAVFENLGVYGRDSLFDVLVDGDRLHLAGWSNGYLCLDVGADPARFLKPIARFDSPGLPISLALGTKNRLVVAEHNAGVFLLPAR